MRNTYRIDTGQLLGWALVGAVFATDLALPLGFAGGMLYIVPVLLGLWVRSDTYTPSVAVAGLVLTTAGFFLSLPADGGLAVFFNRGGAILAIAVTGAGVAMQRRTARTLADSEARNRAILETAIDAIISIDERGTITAANPASAKMFGYEIEELLGRNIKLLMPEPYRTEHNGYLERYLDTGEKRIIGAGRDATALRKSGQTFPIHLSVAEVRSRGERFFTGIVRDISARAALIAELEAKNAELERFTYTVSHDLKSPLITIKGFLGMLEKDAASGNVDRLRADIDRIGRAADTMKSLLDQLLDLSRVGRIVNRPERVPMNELVDETLHLLDGPLRERGVEVTVAGDLPVVHGDRTRLREVVQNLIENAIKFLGDQPEPRVEIGVRGNGDAILYVRDNGVGIDPRYLDRVFGLFERLNPGEAEGTGVGLALVRRIVEVHHGRIWVESEGLGKGATFYLTLPRSDEEKPRGTSETRAAADPARRG